MKDTPSELINNFTELLSNAVSEKLWESVLCLAKCTTSNIRSLVIPYNAILLVAFDTHYTPIVDYNIQKLLIPPQYRIDYEHI